MGRDTLEETCRRLDAIAEQMRERERTRLDARFSGDPAFDFEGVVEALLDEQLIGHFRDAVLAVEAQPYIPRDRQAVIAGLIVEFAPTVTQETITHAVTVAVAGASGHSLPTVQSWAVPLLLAVAAPLAGGEGS